MDDETAKAIASQVSGLNRNLTAIKWLLAALVVIAAALLWFVSHPAVLNVGMVR